MKPILVLLVACSGDTSSPVPDAPANAPACTGAAYDNWAQFVPIFLPRLNASGPNLTRFGWDRVDRNREWRTAAAVPLLALALSARARWLPHL